MLHHVALDMHTYIKHPYMCFIKKHIGVCIFLNDFTVHEVAAVCAGCRASGMYTSNQATAQEYGRAATQAAEDAYKKGRDVIDQGFQVLNPASATILPCPKLLRILSWKGYDVCEH